MLDYQNVIANWLSCNYKKIAFDIYDNFGGNNNYRSKFLKAIIEDKGKLISINKDNTVNKAKTISNIRLRLHKKNKYNTKFNLDELEDFCIISNKTPNEILEISKEPIRTLVLLSEEEIKAIKKNFKVLSRDNQGLQLVCFAFPLLGLFCEVKFENTQKNTVDFWVNKNTNKDPISTTFYLKNVFTNGQPSSFDSYEQTMGAFQDEVINVADSLMLRSFECISTLSSSITSFYRNEYDEQETEEHISTSTLNEMFITAQAKKKRANRL